MQRLADALSIASPTHEKLAAKFGEKTAREWESWAREHDLPLVAVHSPLQDKKLP